MTDIFVFSKCTAYYVFVYLFYIFVCNIPCEVFASEIKRHHYINGRILEVIKPCGIQQCQKLCSGYASCHAINFHVSHLKCELVTDVELGVSREGFLSFEMEQPSFCSAMNCIGQCITTRTGKNFCFDNSLHFTGKNVINCFTWSVNNLRSSECRNGRYTRYTSDYSCLWFSTTKKKWLDAEQDCRNKGGRLLVLNFQENVHIFQQVLAQVKLSGEQLWLGAQDLVKEGEWRWTTNETITFPTMVEDEGRNGNCLLYYIWFHDHNCNDLRRYVCEEL